ncbi:unnamed protein product [Diamesa hyperborea]
MSYSENDSTEFEEITSAIDQLISQSQKNEKDYEILEELLKNLSLSSVKLRKSFEKYEQMEARMTPQMNSKVVRSLNYETLETQKLFKTFKVSRTVFLHNLNLILENADYVCDDIIDKHVRKWRENQMLGHSNEDHARENLNKFQNWCERLTQVLWITRNRLRMGSMYDYFLNKLDDTMPSYVQQFYDDITNLLVSLIKHTIIVEKQPPQVLSSNETFSTNIRLLAGDALHKKMNSSVTVSIVSEQQAKCFENIVEKSDLNCGKLKNGCGKIKFDKKSWKSVATFDALKVTKITKSKNDTNKKLGLLFQSTIIDNDLEIYIKALSMPFVVNVDDNRKPASNDVISWDNVFPVFDRPPFDLFNFLKSTLPHMDKHNAFDKYSSHQNEQNTESDPMKADITLLSFSQIRFNFPIDKSLPAIEPLKYTNTTSPLSPPPRCNFFTRCWSRMNNGEDNDEYDLLS